MRPNHKIFADEWLIDRNGRRAAIAAGFSEKTAEQQASRLLTSVKVKAYIEERLLAAQKRRQETLDDILNELDENRRFALTAETVQSSAATAATMAKAKLLGFVVEKTESKVDMIAKVDIAPKLSKEEWMKAHGLSASK